MLIRLAPPAWLRSTRWRLLTRYMSIDQWTPQLVSMAVLQVAAHLTGVTGNTGASMSDGGVADDRLRTLFIVVKDNVCLKSSAGHILSVVQVHQTIHNLHCFVCQWCVPDRRHLRCAAATTVAAAISSRPPAATPSGTPSHS